MAKEKKEDVLEKEVEVKSPKTAKMQKGTVTVFRTGKDIEKAKKDGWEIVK